MLNRRHIRIKALQALYAYQCYPEQGLTLAEKRLRQSIEDIYVLYLYELRALFTVGRYVTEKIEINRNKRLPTQEDLEPNLRFVHNHVFQWLEYSEELHKAWDKHAVTFGENREILHRAYRDFTSSDEYIRYMENPAEGNQLAADKHIIKYFYAHFLTENESLHQFYEERSMHWSDDLDAAQMLLTKTIKKIGNEEQISPMQPLLKDEEDLSFGLKLLRKAIQEDQRYEEAINKRTQNWDAERIAIIDILCMKLALAELTTFSQIPVKVTLNEYIELTKQYSTSRSGNFINGILDKIKDDMMETGEIRKIGRGLL